MKNDYSHKGYKFRKTDHTATVTERVNPTKYRENIRPLYEIDKLKDATQEPLLTSAEACKDYIDLFLESLPF